MPRVPRRPLRGALTAPDCPSYPHLDSALRYRARLPQQPSSTRQTDCQDHRSRRHRHRPSRRRSSHQPNRPPNRRPSSRPPQRRSNNRPSRPRSRRPVKHQSRSPHRRRLRRPPPSSAEDPDGAPTKPPGQHTAPCRSHRSHSPSQPIGPAARRSRVEGAATGAVARRVVCHEGDRELGHPPDESFGRRHRDRPGSPSRWPRPRFRIRPIASASGST